MSEAIYSLSRLYEGLQSLETAAFPKQCPKCGHVFISLLDLICLSDKSLNSSGLVGSEGVGAAPIVGLYRNCVCGETLFVFCRDRRDVSPEGIRRRETFAQLLEQYRNSGLDRDLVRKELLRVMHGEGSELLRDFSDPEAPADRRERARSLLRQH
jgi:hypothetical protein